MSNVQLSVLLPTHRTGLRAISRIAQICSWAGPSIEIIVRDNSGNGEKRELISQFQGENCHILTVDPCEPLENFSEVLRLAKGEFIFCPADDDLSFDHAIEALPGILERHGQDPSVCGAIGHVIVETANESAIVRYANIDSDDAIARVAGYANFGGPNVLLYSAMRRVAVRRIVSFMNGMPIFLSFHDQIQSLLLVVCGKFIQLPRILYAYDMGIWQYRETAAERDIVYLTAAGLDPVVNTLHWLLCAFEGAVLIRNSDIIPDYPLAQRQAMADQWFSVKFGSFVRDNRSAAGSKFEGDANKIRTKLLASTGHLSFEGLLVEICNVLALFSQDKAERYFEFWNAQINKGAAGRREAGPVAGSAA